LRKGVPYLLEALRLLGSMRLNCRLVGRLELDARYLVPYTPWAEIVGPIPRSQILQMYDWADVLVLPSTCEGSATATYEALACGLPVITTLNTGSVVRHGREGFIVPIRDPEAIADAFDRLLADPELLVAMSMNALNRSHELDLAAYGRRLVKRLIAVTDQSFNRPVLQQHALECPGK